MKISHKKYYEIAEKFCNENDFTFISLDSILKGNRIEITVGLLDNDGKLVERQLIVGCGRQEVEMEKFIYTAIRNDNGYGTDSISLFHFNTHKEAVEWVKQDINRTFAILNIADKELYEDCDRWVYDNDSTVIDWSIRKLPLQDNSTWTDPDYPVRYVKKPKSKKLSA